MKTRHLTAALGATLALASSLGAQRVSKDAADTGAVAPADTARYRACTVAPNAPRTSPPTVSPGASLKDVFQGAFRVGAALHQDVFTGRDARGAAIVTSQFNTTTPENALKWECVHFRRGAYDFSVSDRYVEFGERNGMFVIGHALVWHNQTPRWVFQDAAGNPVSRDTLLARMRDHIHTVVGHYRGRVKGWDVVNEAISDRDGSLRPTPWSRIIGPDFIAKAFQYAHEADPSAELYYNEYSLENRTKRDSVIALVKRLRAQGLTVTAVGSQEHQKLATPSIAEVDAMFDAFKAAGIKLNVTELDVDVLPPAVRSQGAEVTMRAGARPEFNPYPNGLPDSVEQALTRRYADLFAAYVRHADIIDRVTFWGVTDDNSWLNGWPVAGRVNYPLLFDRQGHPKPAFDAVVKTATGR